MYEPTDEQVEALARMHHDYNWTPDMWGDAHPEHQQECRDEWRSIVTSPAFQSVVRSAEASVAREAARIVLAEARWQWEQAARRIPGAQIVAQRMQVVEKCLTNMAERIEEP